MDNQLKSNAALDAAITACNDASTLREVMLNSLQSSGVLIRSRDDQFNNRLVPQAQTPGAPLPASNYRFEREIRFHPESGKRTLLIRGNSQQDLDALEAQILNY
jgi:hypothetical protein